MGLDIVEFVMAVEEAFQLRISDEDATRITTPRRLLNYMYTQLPHGRKSCCFYQRSFFAIRGAMSRRLNIPTELLRPESILRSVLPADIFRDVWAEIGQSLGYSIWPRFRGDRCFEFVFLPWEPRTIGDAARYVATLIPGALKPEGEGWTWIELRRVIDGLMGHQFGIEINSLDDRFVQDLGIA